MDGAILSGLLIIIFLLVGIIIWIGPYYLTRKILKKFKTDNISLFFISMVLIYIGMFLASSILYLLSIFALYGKLQLNSLWIICNEAFNPEDESQRLGLVLCNINHLMQMVFTLFGMLNPVVFTVIQAIADERKKEKQNKETAKIN
jgi:Ca2+/Na+ antiporter